MTSKAKLTELIRRRLANGNPSVNDRVKNAEIHMAIAAAINRLLKVEALSLFKEDGDSMIDGGMLACYEGIAVEHSTGKKCRVLLPATPMVLPDKLGVFSVYPSGYPENEFIPVPAGVYNMLMQDKLLSSINKTVYSHEGRHLIIHNDIIGSNILTVDMKLVIADVDQADEYAPLPVPPEMEADVIAFVVNMYATQQQDESK